MALFQKKRDPILEREARLKSELAEVEARIRKLDAELRRKAEAEPKVRSTTRPGVPTPAAAESPLAEPALEDLRPLAAKNPFETDAATARLNAQGMARFDLAGTLRRWWDRLRGKPRRNPRNPQLVTYLAAGGIEGLPALRHERRVARNRFLLVCAALTVLLVGIFYYLRKW